MKHNDLFEAYARGSDPNTSHEAAASVEFILPHLEEAVLHAVRKSRGTGRNLDELIDDTGLDKVTVSPRLRPLCDKGLVVEKGRRPGKSNRQQTVWVAAEFASL